MTFELTQNQLSGMSDALTTGGTGLIHIAIQLMPYAIAFTIILIIFALVKRWSRLSDRKEARQWDMYERNSKSVSKLRNKNSSMWLKRFKK